MTLSHMLHSTYIIKYIMDHINVYYSCIEHLLSHNYITYIFSVILGKGSHIYKSSPNRVIN